MEALIFYGKNVKYQNCKSTNVVDAPAIFSFFISLYRIKVNYL